MVAKHHGLRTHARHGVAPFAVAALAALALGSTSSAGLLSPCPGPLVQPFQQWDDVASYTLAPNGGFESGADGWTLSNGATVVPGNEGFQLDGAGDTSSLSLPSGSSATSDGTCIGT